jgi:hypothetical protein
VKPNHCFALLKTDALSKAKIAAAKRYVRRMALGIQGCIRLDAMVVLLDGGGSEVDPVEAHRLSVSRPLRRDGNGSRPGKFQGEPTKDCQVGVEADAFDATDAEHRQRVVVLEPSELSLDSGAAPVEPLPLVRAVRDRAEWVTLQGAFPLSEQAWDQLLRVLDVMKPGLVAPPNVSAESGEED